MLRARRRALLLFGLPLGAVLVAYGVLSSFSGRALSLAEFWTFATALIRATPAHLGSGQPLETLRLGGAAFGAPAEAALIDANDTVYAVPLPPRTALSSPAAGQERFVTFATSDELRTYLQSSLPEAGWTYREQFGSVHAFERDSLLLSLGISFHAGTRIRELRITAQPQALTAAEPAVNRAGDLQRAAERIIAFLQGSGSFDQILLDDTLTLLLSPEGGGARVRIPRENLRTPDAWRITTSDRRSTFSLVPPAANTELTTRVGSHLNCREHSLSSLYPELARRPHVGTSLMPPDAGSCLQSWNMTLVFQPRGLQPVLTAVVYDQWEW